jgi:chromosome segregation ATPase
MEHPDLQRITLKKDLQLLINALRDFRAFTKAEYAEVKNSLDKINSTVVNLQTISSVLETTQTFQNKEVEGLRQKNGRVLDEIGAINARLKQGEEKFEDLNRRLNELSSKFNNLDKENHAEQIRIRDGAIQRLAAAKNDTQSRLQTQTVQHENRMFTIKWESAKFVLSVIGALIALGGFLIGLVTLVSKFIK